MSSKMETTQLRREPAHANRPSPFLIGVAGGTGSGKTTVSRRIQEAIGVRAHRLSAT